MSGVNKCIFVGNVGRDAELKYTQGGAAICSFTLAVNEKWKDKDGEQQERVEWVRCQMWGKRAEALGKYLLKGKQVYVEGRMQTRKWQDKDGNDRYTTETNVTDVQLLGGKRGESSGGDDRRRTAQDYDSDGDGHGRAGGFGGDDFGDDDIPF